MISSVHAVVCERAIENHRTNNVTYVEVLDEISSPIFPAVSPRLFVIYAIRRTSDIQENVELTFKVLSGSRQILEQHVTAAFAGKSGARIIIELLGLPILEPGVLTFSLSDGDNFLQNLEVSVKSLSSAVGIG